MRLWNSRLSTVAVGFTASRGRTRHMSLSKRENERETDSKREEKRESERERDAISPEGLTISGCWGST